MTDTTPARTCPLVALLDQLDQRRAAGTPGEWGTYWGDHIGSGVVKTSPGGVQVEYDICEMQDEEDRGCTDNAINPAFPSDDAALIVAAVNALPRLTAAVRAVLRLADEMDEEAAALPAGGTGAGQHYADGLRHATASDAQDIRNVLTAVLAPVAR